jgi:hypothetical protein
MGIFSDRCRQVQYNPLKKGFYGFSYAVISSPTIFFGILLWQAGEILAWQNRAIGENNKKSIIKYHPSPNHL